MARTRTVFTTIFRAGIEIEIESDINVTSWGSADGYWEPGDPPEWEIDRVRTIHAGLALDPDRDLSDAERDAIDREVSDAFGDWLSDEAEADYEWRQEAW